MFRKIIVPVDIAALERGEKILAMARALVEEGGDVILLNVVEDMPSYIAMNLPVDMIENALREARTQLTALKDKSGVAARVEVRTGQPAREILAAAQEHSADLVIIASHRPDFSNYFIGSTADRVVRHATCAVLVDR